MANYQFNIGISGGALTATPSSASGLWVGDSVSFVNGTNGTIVVDSFNAGGNWADTNQISINAFQGGSKNVGSSPNAGTDTLIVSRPGYTSVNIPITFVNPVPSTPSGVSTSTYARDITLSWNAVSGATSYEYRAKFVGGSYGSVNNVGNVTSYDFSGVADGNRVFQVRAVNASGTSDWSSESNISVVDGTVSDTISISDQTGAALNQYFTTSFTVSGLSAGIVATLVSEGLVDLSLTNGSWGSSSVAVSQGDTVYVRFRASSNYSTQTQFKIQQSGGATLEQWYCTTAAAPDSTPDAFDIADVNPADRATYYEDSVTVSGITTTVTASIATTGSIAEIRKNNTGSWVSSSITVVNGDVVNVRFKSYSGWGTTAGFTLTIGTVSDSWNAIVPAQDLDINGWPAFYTTVDCEINTYYYDTITVSGVNDTVNLSVNNGHLSTDNSTWVTSADFENGDTVYRRLMSSGIYGDGTVGQTLTNNSGSGENIWGLNNRAAVTPPVPTGLSATRSGDDINLDWDDMANTTGYVVQVNTGGGWSTLSSPSVSNYSHNNLSDGIYQYRVKSVGEADSAYTSATSSITVDKTPSSISGFSNQTGLDPNEYVYNSFVASGYSSGIPLTYQGSSRVNLSKTNGVWGSTSVSDVYSGDTVYVRTRASASYSSTTTNTISVNSVTKASWTFTTIAAPDSTPDAFQNQLTDVTNAELSTDYFEQFTISGINQTITGSVTSGLALIKKSTDGSYNTSVTGVTNGTTIDVKLTSDSTYETLRSSVINIGGVTATWNITTESEGIVFIGISLGETLSLQDIIDFYGGGDRLSDFVRGGSYVPDITENNAISTTSDGLATSQFFDCAKTV